MVVLDKPTRGVEATRETGSSPEFEDEDVPAKGKRARRHRITRNACKQCRAKKTKCEGQHPICSRCQAGDICCTYDVSEGVTKMQSLKDQLDRKTKDNDSNAALLRILVQGSDQEATELLARLRMAHNDPASPNTSGFKASPVLQNTNRSASHPLLHPLWPTENMTPPAMDTGSRMYALSPDAVFCHQQQAPEEVDRIQTPSSAGSFPMNQQDPNMHMSYPVYTHHEARRMSTPALQYAPHQNGMGRPAAVPAYSMATTNGWPDPHPHQRRYFAH